MKERYITPEMDIVNLQCMDIITTSGGNGETILPEDEF